MHKRLIRHFLLLAFLPAAAVTKPANFRPNVMHQDLSSSGDCISISLNSVTEE